MMRCTPSAQLWTLTPSLTKEQVIFNILGNGSLYVLGATLLAVLVFGINYGLFEQSTTVNARRFSMIIAVLCWLIMIVAIVFVSGHCYLKYGAKLS
jgi:fucose 4-O-acetylase-like acetyltransferase